VIATLVDTPLAIDQVNDALSGLAQALRVPSPDDRASARGARLRARPPVDRGLARLRPRRPSSRRWPPTRSPNKGDTKTAARRTPSPPAEQAVLDLSAAVKSRRPRRIENAPADFELGRAAALDRTRMMVRAGPALGLMWNADPARAPDSARSATATSRRSPEA